MLLYISLPLSGFKTGYINSAFVLGIQNGAEACSAISFFMGLAAGKDLVADMSALFSQMGKINGKRQLTQMW